MPLCPKCQTNIDADFGMIACSGCKTVIFIDIDGHASINNESSVSQEVPSAASMNYHPPTSAAPQEENQIMPQYEPLENEVQQYQPVESAFEELVVEQSLSPAISESAEVTENEQQNNFSDQEVFVTPVSEPLQEPEQIVQQNFDDIADFANSESSMGKLGLLTYSLFIDGIDSADVRNALIEAIEDKRFMWNTDEIVQNIFMGKLEITNISAVKASILVNRIKSLPLNIRWAQYAINQTDVQ